MWAQPILVVPSVVRWPSALAAHLLQTNVGTRLSVNRSYNSSTSGTLNLGNFAPTITFSSQFSYLQIIKSGTTTNIPYATFTPNGSPGTPGNAMWSGSMPIVASQFPTHIIFNGNSATLALF